MGGVCVPFVAIAAARPSKGVLRKSKFPMDRRPRDGAGNPSCDGSRRAAQRAEIVRNGSAWATSAIIFLTMAWPNELKSFAASTKAPGPPMTLLR